MNAITALRNYILVGSIILTALLFAACERVPDSTATPSATLEPTAESTATPQPTPTPTPIPSATPIPSPTPVPDDPRIENLPWVADGITDSIEDDARTNLYGLVDSYSDYWTLWPNHGLIRTTYRPARQPEHP